MNNSTTQGRRNVSAVGGGSWSCCFLLIEFPLVRTATKLQPSTLLQQAGPGPSGAGALMLALRRPPAWCSPSVFAVLFLQTVGACIALYVGIGVAIKALK